MVEQLLLQMVVEGVVLVQQQQVQVELILTLSAAKTHQITPGVVVASAGGGLFLTSALPRLVVVVMQNMVVGVVLGVVSLILKLVARPCMVVLVVLVGVELIFPTERPPVVPVAILTPTLWVAEELLGR